MLKHPFEKIINTYNGGHRQQHQCTCGPSSLLLATTSLDITGLKEEDWYSNNLKRWLPISDFLTRGMALHEACIATEILVKEEAEVRFRRAFKENRPHFTRDLIETLNRNDQIIVINFSQDHLLGRPFEGQGEPHYSVIAGFNLEKLEVTIADVDIEIKETYQCSIQKVFESMAFLNPSFELPRGWILIRRRDRS